MDVGCPAVCTLCASDPLRASGTGLACCPGLTRCAFRSLRTSWTLGTRGTGCASVTFDLGPTIACWACAVSLCVVSVLTDIELADTIAYVKTDSTIT